MKRASALFSILCLCLSACASGYHHRAGPAYRAYHAGRYDDAVRLIEKAKPGRRDELLFLMDKGMILHAAGAYRESNKALAEAEELSDALTTRSLSRETAATLWSEEATDYAGDKHERLLLPVIRMLNYIMLDEWSEALVEVRRLLTQTEKIYGNQQALSNAFSLYLLSLIWEAEGLINDALISLNQLTRQGKEVPYYGLDIKAARSELHLNTPLPPQGSIAWSASEDYRKHKGELVVIAEAGRAPEYVSQNVTIGLITLDMPTARIFPQSFHSARVLIDGKEAGRTAPFYDVSSDIAVALKERQKRSLVRKLVKVPVQTGLYVAGDKLIKRDETESKIAGIGLGLLALSMAVAEKADERSWRTLPAEFQLGRFFVEPGKHEIEIIPEGGGAPIKRTLEISAEKPSLLLLTFPASQAVAAPFGAAYQTPSTRLFKAEEERLRKEMREHPNDGKIKMDLGFVLLRQGRLDIDGLITQGIAQGGELKRGLLALSIVYMVEGRYDRILPWLEPAKAKGPEKTPLLAFCRDTALFLLGRTALAPEPLPLQASRSKDLEDPFTAFLNGLIDEREKRYEDAARQFFAAYQGGLIGEPVVKKAVGAFQKADDAFKQSPEGIEIFSEFAEAYLAQRPR